MFHVTNYEAHEPVVCRKKYAFAINVGSPLIFVAIPNSVMLTIRFSGKMKF